MPSFIVSDGPDQQFLMPPDAREWLREDHLAWQLLRVAEELDVSAFMSSYRADGKSRPAYHPMSMLTLIMYCHCKAIRSSRAIEQATWDDVGARVIMGHLHPDHATIARFVIRHRERVKALFVQTLVIAAKDGLVGVDIVAGDGTVVKANASKTRNATAEQLDLDIAELEKAIDDEVEAWLAQAEAADAADETLFDDDDAGRSGPSALTRKIDTLARRKAAAAKLAEAEDQRREKVTAQRAEKVAKAEATAAGKAQKLAKARDRVQARNDDWQARNEAAIAERGSGLPGTRPVPVDEHADVVRARDVADNSAATHADALAEASAPIPEPDKPARVNTTDPASQLIPAKGGGFWQGHNIQIVVNACQLILSIFTHDNPTDTQALHPALRDARGNLDAAGITAAIMTAVFDAGYASDDNFTTPTPDQQTELLVSVRNEATQTGRRPDDQPARQHHQPSWKTMAGRLADDDGKRLYKRRAAMVEPVFGQLFGRVGKYLYHRNGIDAELGLLATGHNLLKIIKHRATSSQPAPACAT